MNELSKLIEDARNNEAGSVAWGDLLVEHNAGVIFYSLSGSECTASDAVHYCETV